MALWITPIPLLTGQYNYFCFHAINSARFKDLTKNSVFFLLKKECRAHSKYLLFSATFYSLKWDGIWISRECDFIWLWSKGTSPQVIYLFGRQIKKTKPVMDELHTHMYRYTSNISNIISLLFRILRGLSMVVWSIIFTERLKIVNAALVRADI